MLRNGTGSRADRLAIRIAGAPQTRQLIDEARSLSLEEKLLLVEKIWDSIAAEGDAPPLSSW
jgi:hypothetical protein